MWVSAWDVSILLRFINKVWDIIKFISLKWNWPNSVIVFPISLFWSQLLSWRCPKSKAPCSPSSTSFDQTAVILCNKVRTLVEFSAVKFNYDAKNLLKLFMAKDKKNWFFSHITWLSFTGTPFDLCAFHMYQNPSTEQYPNLMINQFLLLKYTFSFL